MPVQFAIAPLADAVARLSAKTPIGSLLKSADWGRVPLALRERAFFSATVTSAEFLEEARQGILQIAQGARRRMADGGEGALQTKEKLVADLQATVKRLGIGQQDPAKQGGLEDIGSVRRLELVVDHNLSQAQEFARWKAGQDADVLDAYPAQEYVRIEPRDNPREDWPDRFTAGGGTLIERRMVALKNDPVWSNKAFNRFETPFPPFDFGSGMGLVDIEHEEAVKLGLLKEEESVEPAEAGFNDTLAASVENLSPKMEGALSTIFGGQVEVGAGRARWKEAA